MLRKFAAAAVFLAGFNCLAQGGHAHAKHNMVLFGESEIFASHIVYKAPHNYQVILSLTLSDGDLQSYLRAKQDHPSDQFIYLLEEMEIKDIASQKLIGGSVFYLDSGGVKHEVIHKLSLTNSDFKVIYFEELPLSLAGGQE